MNLIKSHTLCPGDIYLPFYPGDKVFVIQAVVTISLFAGCPIALCCILTGHMPDKLQLFVIMNREFQIFKNVLIFVFIQNS